MSEFIDPYSEAFAALPPHERHAARRAQRRKNKEAQNAKKSKRTSGKGEARKTSGSGHRTTVFTNPNAVIEPRKPMDIVDDDTLKEKLIRLEGYFGDDPINANKPIGHDLTFSLYDREGNKIVWKPYRDPNDPSPEQIRQACAKLQSTWTEAGRLARQVAPGAVPADIQSISDSEFSSFLHLK